MCILTVLLSEINLANSYCDLWFFKPFKRNAFWYWFFLKLKILPNINWKLCLHLGRFTCWHAPATQSLMMSSPDCAKGASALDGSGHCSTGRDICGWQNCHPRGLHLEPVLQRDPCWKWLSLLQRGWAICFRQMGNVNSLPHISCSLYWLLFGGLGGRGKWNLRIWWETNLSNNFSQREWICLFANWFL